METPSVYIPIDRRRALAYGADLPLDAEGAALFADISGFTPLTEALARALGPQRGAEELTHTLNLVYDALIGEVDRYGGSVIGFSGDAITCWFDNAPLLTPEGPAQPSAAAGHATLRATACALAMQAAMTQFAALPTPDGGVVTLAMKVAIAAGAVRRFLVGDPQAQLIDVLAGVTLDRLAEGEHQAQKGDVVLDPAAAAELGDAVEVVGWRSDPDSGERFAVVGGLRVHVAPLAWPPLPPEALSEDQVRPWVLAPVYERARRGQGEFLAELRPCVAVFLRFTGIDYDSEQAQGQLDAYIRWVQAILVRYEGFLLQLTIGDKGSYLYAAFGAPIAHGDDPRRAVAAALELAATPSHFAFLQPVQIGVTRGRMRTGPYGGSTRRTYGVLGDDVNLSARLMQAAQPGQVLVSQRIYDATQSSFAYEPLPAIRVKGKTDPIPLFALLDRQTLSRSTGPSDGTGLPMVGRQAEQARIVERLARSAAGSGQIVGITAEAGMGKSRLVAEVERAARGQGFEVLAGECQSYGTNNSYLVWEPIWRAFFRVDPTAPLDRQVRQLETALSAINPALVPRLPLLGVVLNLPIPDNALTRSFDAKLRKASLEALLVDCLRGRAGARRRTRRDVEAGTPPSPSSTSPPSPPLLIILEDTHWMDPLSHDLLEVVGRAMSDLPVMLLLAHRPPDATRRDAPRVARLPHFTEVPLTTFSPEEAAQLIELKLAARDWGLASGELEALISNLQPIVTERAQGNPFYIEELLNYLRDQGVDLRDTRALARLDLPTSLQSLILSRLDQLTESQQITLKVASVIGRQFLFHWLYGAYPDLGEVERVQADLERIAQHELATLDQVEPDLVYLFKHVMTQEVTYESLLSATRTLLHGHLARFIEDRYHASLDQYLDLLAFHYERSAYRDKTREYLRRAGEAAQAAYANPTAMDYYRRLLPLLGEADAPGERIAVLLRLGQVLELVSEWDEAGDLYRQAHTLAEAAGDMHLQAQAQSAIGGLLRKQGDYPHALAALEAARASFEALHNPAGVSQVLAETAEVYRLQGKYAEARAYYEEGLQRADQVSDAQLRLAVRAKALKGAGTVANQSGDREQARACYEESLSSLQNVNDKPGMAAVLNNLGVVARFEGDYTLARARYEESMAVFREIGDRWAVSALLNNLGLVARYQHDGQAARHMLEQSLVIKRQLDEKWGIANTLSSLGDVALEQADFRAAHQYLVESLVLNQELGEQTAIAYVLEYLSGLAAAAGNAERALRLAGAAAGLREALGAPLTPAEHEKMESRLASAYEALGTTGSNAALAEGRALTLEQAIAYALAE